MDDRVHGEYSVTMRCSECKLCVFSGVSKNRENIERIIRQRFSELHVNCNATEFGGSKSSTPESSAVQENTLLHSSNILDQSPQVGKYHGTRHIIHSLILLLLLLSILFSICIFPIIIWIVVVFVFIVILDPWSCIRVDNRHDICGYDQKIHESPCYSQ